MRARQPDIEGFVERDGIAVFYEVFGTGEPTILLLPSWQMVHSRQWKAQVPYSARHFRVITFARGNGRSDRPTTPEAYGHREIVADAVAVLDAAGVGEAVFAGTSMGGLYALEAAAWHPERVLAVIAIGAVAPFVGPVTPGESRVYDLFGAGGIAAYQRQVGLNGYREFVEDFIRASIPEPHRSKAVEDAVGYGLQTTQGVLELTLAAPGVARKEEFEDICRQVRCPVLVVHGDGDMLIPYDHGTRPAALLGVGLVTVEDGGHTPSFGDPVRCNLLIKEFTDSVAPMARPRTWRRAAARALQTRHIRA